MLEEIGAGDKPRLLVLNKADLLDADERREALLRHPGAVLVSALTGEGIEELRERVEEAFEDTLAEVELLVPYSEGARLHELHEVAGELERTEREDGVLVHAPGCRVAELHRFDDLAVARASRVARRGAAGRQAEGRGRAADARARGGCRAGSLRLRGGASRAGGAVERWDRDRGGDSRGARRAGAAAVGAGAGARDRAGQQPRA